MDGRAELTGTYRLMSTHGTEYDRVVLRIVYPDRFPLRGRHPNVFLERHRDRWRNGRDSHIEPHWRMCLYVTSESRIDFRASDSLTHLFEKIHVFLLLERLYQRELDREITVGTKAEWPGPQRAHGTLGLLEAVRADGRPGRNAPCVCGSGEKFKRCCLNKLDGLEARGAPLKGPKLGDRLA